MESGLSIVVVDPDDDYLGIEIQTQSARFSGTTRIYAGLDELSRFASRLAGFPKSTTDERQWEFGSRDPRIAGGFCRVRLFCVDKAGHTALEVSIVDDDGIANAEFGFRVEAADIDRFVEQLRHVEGERAGVAALRRAPSWSERAKLPGR